MQISKVMEGSIATGTYSARQIAWGAPATMSVYPNVIDAVNSAVADFLANTCGVDAAYEARGENTNKFLWIYGLPVLFQTAYNSYTWNLSVPGVGRYDASSLTGTVVDFATNAAAATRYSFTAYFAGNPETGFLLRFKPINSSVIYAQLSFYFGKAINLCTNANAVNVRNAAFNPGVSGNYNRIYEVSETGAELFGLNGVYPYFTAMPYNNVNLDFDGKFPLIPITGGIYKLKNLYMPVFAVNSPIPSALSIQTEVQPEFTIGGRTFINFGGSNATTTTTQSYSNCGIVEVTGT